MAGLILISDDVLIAVGWRWLQMKCRISFLKVNFSSSRNLNWFGWWTSCIELSRGIIFRKTRQLKIIFKHLFVNLDINSVLIALKWTWAKLFVNLVSLVDGRFRVEFGGFQVQFNAELIDWNLFPCVCKHVRLSNKVEIKGLMNSKCWFSMVEMRLDSIDGWL